MPQRARCLNGFGLRDWTFSGSFWYSDAMQTGSCIMFDHCKQPKTQKLPILGFVWKGNCVRTSRSAVGTRPNTIPLSPTQHPGLFTPYILHHASHLLQHLLLELFHQLHLLHKYPSYSLNVQHLVKWSRTTCINFIIIWTYHLFNNQPTWCPASIQPRHQSRQLYCPKEVSFNQVATTLTCSSKSIPMDPSFV